MANLILRSFGTNLFRANSRFMGRMMASNLTSKPGTSLTVPGNQEEDTVTHTGQVFERDDYRRSRYLDCDKVVNRNFAIDLIKEEPVIICSQRVVASDSGGPLGHPRVYINLDPPGYHICGYSGRRFVLKKNYDEKTMGPSITYEQYLKEIGQSDDDVD